MQTEIKERENSARKHIIEAFLRIYEEKNIEKITINEIMNLAGYNRNTFYNHFGSIYDLLEQIENEIAEMLGDYMDYRMVKNREEMKDVFISIYEGKDRILKTLMKKDEESRFSAKLSTKFIEVASKKCIFSNDEDINGYVTEYKVAGAVACLRRYYRRDGEKEKINIDKVVDIMLELLNSGVWKMKEN